MRQDGQACVEVLGFAALALVLGAALCQLLAVGYATLLAGNASEAGALALAARADAVASARNALPGWTRRRASVEVANGRVEVKLRPPALLDFVGRELEVSSTAHVVRP